MTTRQQAERHQSDLQRLVKLLTRAFRGLWPGIKARPGRPDLIRDGLLDALPALVEQYGQAAATLGADWYDEVRDELEIPGSFRATPTDFSRSGTFERVDALTRWSVRPMFEPLPKSDLVVVREAPSSSPDGFVPSDVDTRLERTQLLVEQKLEQVIRDVDRQSVLDSALVDPRAEGWQRMTSPGSKCAFCAMLAGRGAVYSEETADFASHINCQCVAVTAFAGQEKPVKEYEPSERIITAEDRARTRAWMRENGYLAPLKGEAKKQDFTAERPKYMTLDGRIQLTFAEGQERKAALRAEIARLRRETTGGAVRLAKIAALEDELTKLRANRVWRKR